mmetsp:Transcript_36550/g.91504  ORF Transcript_36550/g.91504 Transcript_36550/m.91504 type:complete len:237 (+) Transcript_36550:1520-2230(+)
MVDLLPTGEGRLHGRVAGGALLEQRCGELHQVRCDLGCGGHRQLKRDDVRCRVGRVEDRVHSQHIRRKREVAGTDCENSRLFLIVPRCHDAGMAQPEGGVGVERVGGRGRHLHLLWVGAGGLPRRVGQGAVVDWGRAVVWGTFVQDRTALELQQRRQIFRRRAPELGECGDLVDGERPLMAVSVLVKGLELPCGRAEHQLPGGVAMDEPPVCGRRVARRGILVGRRHYVVTRSQID